MEDKGSSIVVVGSSNVDLIARVSHLPSPGETVGEAVYTTAYGGKGANQAIAAARTGGEVTFVSNLGEDAYGRHLLPYFRDNGLATDHIYLEKGHPTGVAFILVADSGENCISVAPGANWLLKGEKLEQVFSLVEQSRIILLQFEIPYQSVVQLIEHAAASGVKVALNPAPARKIGSDVLSKVDILILNETEAEAITGLKFSGDTPLSIAGELFRKGPGTVILTMGHNGVFVYTADIRAHLPAHQVPVVDTTAAGDTFCGAFVTHLARTGDVSEAARYANAAAALSVTTLGAQPSIPRHADIEAFLREEPAVDVSN
ncbi:MAG: ribokinase [Tannerellaceae bacterium]|nr:ribokinase [Tannerellaceae bacterium]